MRDKYDVVIVGSGPAATTFARSLKENQPRARVLMVEAGPVVTSPPGRHVRTIADPVKRVAAQMASQGPDSRPADYKHRVARVLSPARGRTSELVARPGTWLLNPAVDDDIGMPAAALSSNLGGMGAHWSVDYSVVAEALMLSHTSPNTLRELAPNVVGVHGKFYNMSPVPGQPDQFQTFRSTTSRPLRRFSKVAMTGTSTPNMKDNAISRTVGAKT